MKNGNAVKLAVNIGGGRLDLEKKSGTGTSIFGYRFYEESLGALRNNVISYAVYDKMRRSDPQIKRMLTAINTPLLGANFSYNPKNVDDKEQVKQADFKNKILYKWMDKSWSDTIGEILTYLAFGFAVFEPVYQKMNDPDYGQIITLSELGFIKQGTIREWYLENGIVSQIRQQYTGQYGSFNKILDSSDFIFFTNSKEGDNYEGVSILRSCYGSYIRKDLAYKLDIIGLEKMAIGTPVVFVPDRILDDEKELSRLDGVLSSYTSNENQYVMLPESLKDGGFKIEKGEYDSDSVSKTIIREDNAIISSVLASFLDIGTQIKGGNAQSTTLYQMFIDSLSHIGYQIIEKLDPLVHSIYVMNFGEPKDRLEMTISNITKKDQKIVQDIISGYSKAGIIQADDNIEAKIRSDLELPELVNSNRDKSNPSSNSQACNCCGPFKFSRSEKLAESKNQTVYEKAINLSDIETLINSSKDRYNSVIRSYLEQAKSKYMSDLRAALKAENPRRSTMALKIGFMSQMGDELKRLLKSVLDKARAQAKKEIGGKAGLSEDPGITPDINDVLSFRVGQISDSIKTDFENNSTLFALNKLNDGQSGEIVAAFVSDKIDSFIDSIKPYRSADAIVPDYVNIGRNNFFFSNQDVIAGFQYSAKIEGNVCPLCADLNGKTFKISDESALEYRPPLHWGCWCILVPILLSQEQPEWSGLNVDGVSQDVIDKYYQF